MTAVPWRLTLGANVLGLILGQTNSTNEFLKVGAGLGVVGSALRVIITFIYKYIQRGIP